jgi:hypothetical protein
MHIKNLVQNHQQLWAGMIRNWWDLHLLVDLVLKEHARMIIVSWTTFKCWMVQSWTCMLKLNPKLHFVDYWCTFVLHQFALHKKLLVLPKAFYGLHVSLLSTNVLFWLKNPSRCYKLLIYLIYIQILVYGTTIFHLFMYYNLI